MLRMLVNKKESVLSGVAGLVTIEKTIFDECNNFRRSIIYSKKGRHRRVLNYRTLVDGHYVDYRYNEYGQRDQLISYELEYSQSCYHNVNSHFLRFGGRRYKINVDEFKNTATISIRVVKDGCDVFTFGEVVQYKIPHAGCSFREVLQYNKSIKKWIDISYITRNENDIALPYTTENIHTLLQIKLTDDIDGIMPANILEEICDFLHRHQLHVTTTKTCSL